MTDAQRDTWSAWAELDGGQMLDRDHNFLPAETTTCVQPPLPPAAPGAPSTSDLRHIVRAYPEQVNAAADRILRGSRDGRLVDAVAAAVIGKPGTRDTWLDQLEQSALTGPPTFAYDGDGDGYLGAWADFKNGGLRWSTPQVDALLDAFAQRPDTWRRFLVGLAQQQAHDILAATKQRPASASTNTWAAQIAAMDAMLGDVLAFPGNGRVRGTVASFSDAVIAAVDGRSDVAAQLDREHPKELETGAVREGYKYAIVAGYVRNGVAAPPASTLRHGMLPPLDDLSGEARVSLGDWALEGKTYQPIDDAVEDGDWAFTDRIFGCCRPD